MPLYNINNTKKPKEGSQMSTIKLILELILTLLTGFILVLLICLTMLIGCQDDANAGVQIKPLTAHEIIRAYDDNQTMFISRCFTQNTCSEAEVSKYFLTRDQLINILNDINPDYTVDIDNVWNLF